MGAMVHVFLCGPFSSMSITVPFLYAILLMWDYCCICSYIRSVPIHECCLCFSMRSVPIHECCLCFSMRSVLTYEYAIMFFSASVYCCGVRSEVRILTVVFLTTIGPILHVDILSMYPLQIRTAWTRAT